MSYALMQADICNDALKDVKRRIADVEGLLDTCEEQGKLPDAEIERQLRYLERLLRTRHSPDARSLRLQVDALRHKADNIKSVSQTLDDHTISGLTDAAPQTLETPLSVPSPGNGVNKIACSSNDRGSSSCSDAGQGGAKPSGVAHVASFLYPEKPQHEAEDEVRMLSAEGRLTETLSSYPTMAVPGTQSALIMRNIRTFTDEDEQEQERFIILQFQQQAENVYVVNQMIHDQVVIQGHGLDAIEAHVDGAEKDTAEAVEILKEANQHKIDRLKWLAPSVGIVILGGGIVAVGGAAATGCAACVVLRLAVVGGTLAVGGVGTSKICKWQEEALNSMMEHLPEAFVPMPHEMTEMLSRRGCEVQERLLSTIRDRSTWSRGERANDRTRGLEVRHRKSVARDGGYAYLASFPMEQPVLRAFQCLQQAGLSGSLDPGCEVVWSRPLGSAAAGTSLRYLFYSDWLFPSRDFYCVCQCAAVEQACSDGVEGQPQPPQQYVFAVMSLEAELLASTGLPSSNNGIDHGSIHISGIMLTDDGYGGCLVDVLGDVNPEVPGYPFASSFVDVKLKNRVKAVADRFASELKKFGEADQLTL